MNNEIITNGVQMNSIVNLSADDITALSKAGIIPDKTPLEQVAIFKVICNEKGLSPYSKQIYLIERNDKNKGKVYSTQTGIDGFRALAERTGKYAGSSDPIFDDGLTQYQCIAKKMLNPLTATITVKKIVGGFVCDFTATATWEAYKPAFNDFMWKKMPYLMLSKCAESLALRKAFPDALSGIYTNEEMQQADYVVIEDKPKQIAPTKEIETKMTAEQATEINNIILFKNVNCEQFVVYFNKNFGTNLKIKDEKVFGFGNVFSKVYDEMKLYLEG